MIIRRPKADRRGKREALWGNPFPLPLGAAAKQRGIKRSGVPSPANARSPAVRLSFACGVVNKFLTSFEDLRTVYLFGKQIL